VQFKFLRAVTSKHAQAKVNPCQLTWRHTQILHLKHEKKAIANSAWSRTALWQRMTLPRT